MRAGNKQKALHSYQGCFFFFFLFSVLVPRFTSQRKTHPFWCEHHTVLISNSELVTNLQKVTSEAQHVFETSLEMSSPAVTPCGKEGCCNISLCLWLKAGLVGNNKCRAYYAHTSIHLSIHPSVHSSTKFNFQVPPWNNWVSPGQILVWDGKPLSKFPVYYAVPFFWVDVPDQMPEPEPGHQGAGQNLVKIKN